jgi:hypothetical protein
MKNGGKKRSWGEETSPYAKRQRNDEDLPVELQQEDEELEDCLTLNRKAAHESWEEW